MSVKHAQRRAQEVNQRAAQYRTFDRVVRQALEAHLLAAKTLKWPSDKYATDPVGFARDILGKDPWSKQRDILNALVTDDRVAVTSGHKTGKSMLAVIAALWWYCSRPTARVIMTSTTAKQVNTILWRELCMVLQHTGICVNCVRDNPDVEAPCPHSALIPEQPAQVAATGLHAYDFREIWGFSSDTTEAVAGISGPDVLYIVDEASGVPAMVFEAIYGNLAAKGKLLLLSNPTKNVGVLFDAFHSKSKFWTLFRISCEDTPNVIQNKTVIQGMVERSWIEMMREEYGEKSSWFQIRVLGKHALSEEGRPFDLETITAAFARWEDAPEEGRLCIGVDPSKGGEKSDDTAFAVRRGSKIIEVRDKIKADIAGLVDETRRLIIEYSHPGDSMPLVVYDLEGPVGYELSGPMKEASKDLFECVGVRSSEKAKRRPKVWENTATELVANVEYWMKNRQLALPMNQKLEEELRVWEYYVTAKNLRRVDKKVVKSLIGHSPDRFDAVALSLWEPIVMQQTQAIQQERDGGVAKAHRPALGMEIPATGRGGGMDPFRR